MKNNAKISVIVPVYNVEKYLRQCVESILTQTYTNLEVILVDDGSPDNCPAICDEYAAKDDRVRVIHKENGGQGSARNMALDICTGEYIAFVDSDDWLEPTAYEELMGFVDEKKLDVVYLEARRIVAEKPSGRLHHYYEDPTVCGRDETLIRILKNEISAEPWLKICRRHCWEGVRFPENRIYEDVAVSFLPLVYAESRVGFYPKELYNYRINPQGTTQSRKHFARCHFFLSLKDKYEYAAQNVPEAAPAALGWAARLAMGAYLDYHANKWTELADYSAEAEQFLSENQQAIVKDREMPLSVRASARLYYASSRLFTALYRMLKPLRKN